MSVVSSDNSADMAAYMYTLFPCRLMGPRRKLTLAISDLKEQQQLSESEERKKETVQRAENDGGSSSRKTSRPPLMKQSSTDVTQAYRLVHTYVHNYACSGCVILCSLTLGCCIYSYLAEMCCIYSYVGLCYTS